MCALAVPCAELCVCWQCLVCVLPVPHVCVGSANQLRQLKTSLSQHQDLLDGREQESHHFALACEEAAATKAALDAERAHSASLQEDVRKLAGELAIEESALVKQTAKREAAETKWSVAADCAADC